MPQLIDLTSRQFGRLTVIRRNRTEDTERVWWLCLCDCGQQITVRSDNLITRRTMSCGCYQRELATQQAQTLTLTHGHSRRGKETKTYRAWCGMLSRCNNPNTPDWPDYGGRGIEVRFSNYEAFLAHAGEAPPGKSIDRWPDKNGHYEPGNVRWATPKEQANNKRPYKNGPSSEAVRAMLVDSRPMTTIAKAYSVSLDTVWRIKRGLRSP